MICIDPKLLSGQQPNDPVNQVQVYPNPVNSTATFRFNTNKETFVKIEIFSKLGELVGNPCSRTFPQGSQTVQWNAVDNSGQKLSSGIYFYRITQGNLISTGKLLLVN